MKKTFTMRWLYISIILFVLHAPLLAQKQDSVIRISSNVYAWASSTVMAPKGNITIGGIFEKSGYINSKNQTLTGSDSSDAFIARTSESGNLIWEKTFGGKGDNEVIKVVVDGTGNSYITGYFTNGFIADGIQFDSVNANNGFIAKVDNAGKIIWAKTFAVSFESYHNSLFCESAGSVYLNLVMNDSIKIAGQVFKNNNLTYSGLLLKLDQNGNVLWSKVLLNRNGVLGGLCTDNFGHLYIGGSYNTGVINWGPQTIPGKKDTTSQGLFMAKLNSSDGNMIWFKSGLTTNYSEITNILMGGDGSMFAAGFFADTLSMPGFKINTVPHTYAGTPDIIVMHLDTSGNVLWHQFFGSDEPQYVDGFCLDNNDNVYVAGTLDIPITFGTKSLFKTKARDGYVMMFEKEGSYLQSLSSKALFPNSFCGFQGIMTDQRNKLYVTGNINYETQIGDDTVTCPGANVGFIWSVHSGFNGVEPDHIILGQNEISIFPNPLSSNNLNINLLSNPHVISNIECFDATGKLIYCQKLEANAGTDYTIQLPEIKPGLYMIKLVSENGVFEQKFLKN